MPTQEVMEERLHRVRELARLGMSTSQIATALGITKRTVQRYREKAGCSVPHNTTPMSAEEVARAEEMLADGCSVAEVARTLGRADTTVHKRFPGRSWSQAEVIDFITACRVARKGRRTA